MQSWSLDLSENVQYIKVFAIFECLIISYNWLYENAFLDNDYRLLFDQGMCPVSETTTVSYRKCYKIEHVR